MPQRKAGVVSWINSLILYCIEFFFTCFPPACVFVVFDRNTESDFLMSCYDPITWYQTQYQYCLSGNVSLVALIPIVSQ